MIEFYGKSDEELYDLLLSKYKDLAYSKFKGRMKQYAVVDGRICGEEVIAFRHPKFISWCRFKGTFAELRDKLAFDFPIWFPDVKFYIEISYPICF